MAGQAEALIAAQTKLLLRCQQVRVDRRRVAAARAARAERAAAAAAAAAAAEFDRFEAARQAEMARSYDGLMGCAVDAATLQALPILEAQQRAGAEPLAAAVSDAAARAQQAALVVTEASADLAAAMRKAQQRERLAGRASDAHRTVVALAEEFEREDAATDSWRPAA